MVRSETRMVCSSLVGARPSARTGAQTGVIRCCRVAVLRRAGTSLGRAIPGAGAADARSAGWLDDVEREDDVERDDDVDRAGCTGCTG